MFSHALCGNRCGSGLVPIDGGFIAADQPTLAALNETFVTGNVLPIIEQGLANITYLLSGRVERLQTMLSDWQMWSMWDSSNAPLPSAYALQDLSRQYLNA